MWEPCRVVGTKAIHDAPLLQIVRGHLESNAVTGENAYLIDAHASGEVCTLPAQCQAGHGEKAQIRMMIGVLLPKADPQTEDAADALAIAVTHAHHRQSVLLRVAAQ